ncbi:hypothetical protein HME9304_01418 [Flagellimonas maritima]|uniref:DUF3592 domain-containing protein n=1 Tax=Flagellimonas maritima TaxID=1383885 RepID=A0A2Z4LT13_9FLAO|nr:DUF3592 domain-containing protein [Allomuricauda aurantiaca]AWX44417.1 hypothetical protein HME9304_01418 [Allomuricauda aurantiaca]
MATNKYSMWLIIYSMFFGLGLVLLYFSIQQYQKTQNLILDGIKTTAIVSDVLTKHGSDGNTYTPIFEFKDRKNKLMFYKSPISSNPPAYKRGEKVKIIYDKTDSSTVKTISFWGLYRTSVILLMVAAPLLIIGSCYLLYTLR